MTERAAPAGAAALGADAGNDQSLTDRVAALERRLAAMTDALTSRD